LRRQTNLRYQNQNFFPLPNDLFHGSQVNLGLAAACHAVQKKRMIAALLQCLLNRLPCLKLIDIKLHSWLRNRFLRLRGEPGCVGAYSEPGCVSAYGEPGYVSAGSTRQIRFNPSDKPPSQFLINESDDRPQAAVRS